MKVSIKLKGGYFMHIKLYRVSLIIVAVIVIIASIVSFNYIKPKENHAENFNMPSDEFQYLLKEHEQKIGVYRANETSPFMTIDVYVTNLPALDQEDLKRGIMVKNDDKLKMIIEDFDS